MDSLNLRNQTPEKPLMLKDYLLDDLSSCSSGGFRSYPRLQCCTTVRFLLEIDLNTSDLYQSKRSHSKSKQSATISALHRASEALINAVKQFPFAGGKDEAKPRREILRRSLSQKILRRSFWKRSDHEEVERWKTSGELVSVDPEPSDHSNTMTAAATAVTTTGSTRNSCSESPFAVGSGEPPCSSGESEANSAENDAVENKESSTETVGAATATTTKCSAESARQMECPKEEKEQLSPVSVMDFPCDDGEDEVSSPLECPLNHLEGSKQKLKPKVQHFRGVAQLEPVDLEKLIRFSESGVESLDPPPNPLLVPVAEGDGGFRNKGGVSILLSDLARERAKEEGSFGDEAFGLVEDWMHGRPGEEAVVGWEVEARRHAYLSDMEKKDNWGKWLEGKGREEVALEAAEMVFASLVKEMLLDLFTN